MVYSVKAAVCHLDNTYHTLSFDMKVSGVKKESEIWEATKNIIMKAAETVGTPIAAVGLIEYEEKI